MSESNPTVSPDWPQRLLPERALPPYSYVTGKFPHPVRDAAGHQFGQPDRVEDPLNPSEWRQSESYRFGIDLFNQGYYWEAHESWEGCWHAVERTGAVGSFLKALIKLAAAGVKAREGRPAGVQRHGTRARTLLLDLAISEPQDYAGLSLNRLIDLCDRLIADPQKFVDISNRPVVIVLPALRVNERPIQGGAGPPRQERTRAPTDSEND
ncbi:MAG: DUF309 domain-containing protein [Pirellulaceae bacterium]|nr:DUF309 domain-containing protein [Pirellulaceae bacterium]